MESSNWMRENSLVVKPGVIHRITERDISGWQGRLIEKQNDQLTLQWDSLTLKSLPRADILKCESCGQPWSACYLKVQDVLPAVARDNEEDVRATVAVLEAQYSWLSLGEQGERIRQIVDQ